MCSIHNVESRVAPSVTTTVPRVLCGPHNVDVSRFGANAENPNASYRAQPRCSQPIILFACCSYTRLFARHAFWQLNCSRLIAMSMLIGVLRILSFLPDVLGTASADTRCARHLCPFCFALLFFICSRKRTAARFRPHHKVRRLRLSQTRRKTLRSPKKARSPVWEQPASRFCAQAQQGRKKETLK